MDSVISIALIEDNHLVREGLSALLNRLPDLRVVAKEDRADMARLIALCPRVVLLDLGLRTADSLRVAEQLRQDCPAAKVIVMDLMPLQDDLSLFVHAGVAGFIMKDASVEDLVATIRSVAQGNRVLPPEMTGSLFSEIARDSIVASPSAIDAVRMTRREREVVDLIAEGLSNKDIAGRLDITAHTVKSHVHNIMEKLMLHTRLQISAYAHRDSPSSSTREN
jgi:two-component system nitrate/nitrite response regulator NarL